MFTPDKWGEVTKFKKFHISTYTFNKSVEAAVHGVEAHFNKSLLLNNLANRLIPNLIEEEREIKDKGYTSAIFSVDRSRQTEVVLRCQ